MGSVEVDVLVVGGGSQGLWLLNDLDRLGYRAILIERDELGSGQTCHSHALIHRGHYYDDVNMMILLNAAAQFWRGFINRAGLEPLNQSPALVGLGPGVEQRYTAMWDDAGLPYRRSDALPAILEGSKIAHLYETEEFSVDAHAVMASLADNVDHCLYKLDDEESLQFDMDNNSVDAVTAIIGSREVIIHPKMVVLCAGGQNLALLEKLGGAYDEDGSLVQARRQSTMLCLRSKSLPPLTAVFPVKGGVKGLFICSRKCAETGQNVWLVSDHNSLPFNPGIGADGSTDTQPQSRVVGRIIESLVGCIPILRESGMMDQLEACVYTGLTSEREFGSGDHMTDCFIEPFHFTNVLTIWPTKLTLTPFASNVAIRFIRSKLPSPNSVHARKINRWPESGDKALSPPFRPTVAPETWTKDPFETGEGVKSEWQPFSSLHAELVYQD